MPRLASHLLRVAGTWILATVAVSWLSAASGQVLPTSGDVGSVGTAGSSAYDGATGTYTLQGAGVDIGGSADAFRFTYVSVTGDFQIVGRVASVQNTNGAAEGGVLLRESTSANAKSVSLVVTPTGGALLQGRLTAGGLTATTTLPGRTAPQWTKLIRVGNLVSGYVSVDGTAWEYVGQASFSSLAANVLVGVAVSSHVTTTRCTASFTNVSVTMGTMTDAAVPNAPTGLTLLGQSDVSATLGWSPAVDDIGVSAYTIFRGGTQVGATAGTMQRFTDTALTPGSSYLYTVRASDLFGRISIDSVSLSVTASATTIPAPWVHREVGTVLMAGGAAFSAGVFTVNGSGADIGGSADAGHFLYQPLNGNGQIIARVTSVQNVSTAAKAGVMIRESTNAGSVDAFLGLTASKTYLFQSRASTGAAVTATSATSFSAFPYWVKLIRNGAQVNAYRSTDGVSWTYVSGAALSLLPGAAQIGLAVTSKLDGTLCASAFDNVSVTTGNPADTVAPSTPGSPAAGVPTDVSVKLTWTASTDNVGVIGYQIYRNGVLVTTLGPGVFNYIDTALTPGTAYVYTIKAIDGAGLASAPTANINVTTAAGTLPSPWKHQEVGDVVTLGASGYAGSTFTVAGAGASGIGGTADAFHYTYQAVFGDGEIVARVASEPGTPATAKAGVMLRESMAPGARSAFISITPGSTSGFIRRLTSDGSSATTAAGSLRAPYWVKLSKSGNTITAYTSTNGTSWASAGSATVAFASPVFYAGMASTSLSSSTTFSANFDQASVNFAPACGLRMWLRADADVVYDSSTGRVSSWLDQSGTAIAAVQSDVPSQPIRAATGLGGKPTIQFNGAGSFLQTPAMELFKGSNDFTFVFVARPGTTQLDYADIFDYNHDNTTGFVFQQYGAAVNSFNLTLFPTPIQLTASTPTLIVASKGADGGRIYQDGIPRIFSSVAPTYTFTGPRPVAIAGKVNRVYNRYFNGDISEILFFNRALSTDERRQLENYLIGKYALRPAPASAPGGYSVGAVSGTQISVLWQPVTDATSYEIERKLSSGSVYGRIATVGADTLAFLDGALIPATGYDYRIRAVNGAGASPYSATITATTTTGLAVPLDSIATWFRADAGVYLDAGGKVEGWENLIGLNSAVLAQGDPARRPTLITASPTNNGRPIINFNGSSTTMQSAAFDLFGAQSDFSVFVVARAGPAQVQMADIFDYNHNTVNGFVVQQNNATTGDLNRFNVSGFTATIPFASDRMVLENPVKSGTDYRVYRNGELFSVETGPVSWAVAPPRTSAIGSKVDLAYGGRFYNGDVAEILIYKRALTDSEREAVNAYLQQKYHFVSVAPVVPTNGSAAALAGTQVSLNWSSSATDWSVVYDIERKMGAGSFVLVASVSNTLSWIDSTAAAGTTYTYRIRARNYQGVSGYSAEFSVTTLATGTAMPLTNMRLWLKADAGVVPGSQGVWLDQSGLNNHAAQPTGAAQPLLVENAINGRSVVRFNGTNNFLSFPNLMVGATAAEAYIVLKRSNVTTTAYRLWSMGTEASSAPDYYTAYPGNFDGMIYERFGTTVRKTTGKPAQPLDQYHLYNVLSQNGEFTSRLNGVVHYTTNSNTYSFAPVPYLGGYPGSYANYFGGDIAELIIYDRALSQAERDAVGTYLNQKYQFIAPTAPTPTNGTAVALAGTQVSLNWSSAATDWSVVYDIERKAGAGSFGLVATVANTLSWIDTTAVAGTTYTYRIRARNYQGISGYSAEFSVTTPSSGTAMPLTSMRLWLKADAGAVLGSENIWLDQSGLSQHAVQGDGTRQPFLVEGAINANKPVIRFNSAAGDFFYMPNFMGPIPASPSLPAGLPAATAAEAFVVLKRSGVTTTAFRLWLMGNELASAPDYYTAYPGNADGGIYERFGTTVRKTTGKPAQPLDQYHLYNVLSRDGEFTNRVNGALHYTTSTNTYGFAPAPYLGGYPFGSYANYFNGDIAELIIYDRALSRAERDAVGTYLNQKYQFIAPTAPTPTNGTAVALAGTQVSLNWSSAATDWSVVYDIERKAGAGSFGLVATVANTLSWIDATAVAGTTYTYRIRARNYQGISGYSAEFSVTTPSSGTAMPLSNMRLWLKADAGTVLGSENIWLDQSGQNNHASQPSGPAQPLLVENALNVNKPVIRFNSAGGQFFYLPNFMAGATAAEGFVVLKRSNVATTAFRLWSMGTEAISQPDYYTVYPYNADGMIYERFGTTVRKTTGKPAQPLDRFHLYNVLSRDGEFTNRLNGVLNYTTSSNTYGFATAPTLGGFPGSYANYFDGDIAELIIYDRALSQTERDAVGTYLNQKYQFIASTAPTPTNGNAVALAGTQVSLTWNNAASNSSVVYDIERMTGGGSFALLATVANTLSWIDTTAVAGTTFTYRIRARNYQGVSGYSASFGVTTPLTGSAMPLSSMRLWLKADAGAVLGPENIWLDQSGLNNHATQVSGPLQPLLVENALNGHPVIRFDGTGQHFALPNFMAGATAAEVFVVLKRSNVTTTAYRLWSMGTEAVSQPDYYTVYPYNADGMIYERFGTTVRKTTGKPAQSLDQYHLYNVVSRDGEFTNRLNGVVNYATNGNTYGFSTAPYLGGFPGSYANYFGGDIAELIIYDRALTGPERERVSWYLAAKYMIPDYDLVGDGLTTAQRLALGLNPFLADSNGDGISDVLSLQLGINPLGTGGFNYHTMPNPNGPPPVDPNDHTGPVITVTEPANAVPLP